MAYQTDTVASSREMFDDIVTALQATAFMGAGSEWTLLMDCPDTTYPYANGRVVLLKAPGDAAVCCENIYIGLEYQESGSNAWFFVSSFANKLTTVDYPNGGALTWKGLWATSTGYAAGDVVYDGGSNYWYLCKVAHTSAGGSRPSSTTTIYWTGALTNGSALATYVGGFATTTLIRHKFWSASGTDTITYWLAANKYRFNLLTKSNTGAGSARYHFTTQGGVKRVGTIDFNPYPVLITGNNDSGDSANYTDSGDAVPLIYEGGVSSANQRLTYCGPLLLWYLVNGSSAITTWMRAGIGPTADPVSGEVSLNEVHLTIIAASQQGFWGTIDGAYVVSYVAGMLSEDTITVGGDTYLIFENVYRGLSSYYFAMKLA